MFASITNIVALLVLAAFVINAVWSVRSARKNPWFPIEEFPQEEESPNVKQMRAFGEQVLNRADKSIEALEKNIIFLSAGILGATATFIEKASGPEYESIRWSWIFLGIALGTSMLGYYIAYRSFLRDWEIGRIYFSKDFPSQRAEVRDAEKNRIAPYIHLLNRLTMLSFIVGIGFLISFAWQRLEGAIT